MAKTARKSDQKLQVFVREWLIDENGTRAAIAAGYSQKSAAVTASKLLKNPKVQNLIDVLTEQRLQRLDITADRILEEVAKLAYTDMGDFLQVSSNGDVTVDVSKVYKAKKNGESVIDPEKQPYQTAAIQEFSVEEYTEGKGDNARLVKQTKFKLAPKIVALELLGRFKSLKLWTDKLEVGADDDVKTALFLARKQRSIENSSKVIEAPERLALNE